MRNGYTKLDVGADEFPPLNILYYQDTHYQSLQERSTIEQEQLLVESPSSNNVTLSERR